MHNKPKHLQASINTSIQESTLWTALSKNEQETIKGGVLYTFTPTMVGSGRSGRPRRRSEEA